VILKKSIIKDLLKKFDSKIDQTCTTIPVPQDKKMFNI